MSASAPHSSPALALEELLEGRGIVRKAAGGGLLTGLGARLTRASALAPRGGARESLPTGVESLDRLLSGGLPRGGFVEVVARRSSGRFSLAISALAAATSCGETAAFVDVGGHFDPQSAEEAGVDLQRLLWVRPEKLKHAVAAAEMLLATGFALVVVDLGVPPVRGRFVPDAAWVRLERSARDRGAALLLLSPYRVGATAEAVVSLDAAQPVWRGDRRAPPMLSGIGARMTLRKDASAREGARGEMRLSVDPVLESPSLAAGEGRGEGLPASPTVVGAAPAAALSRRDILGVASSLHNSSASLPLAAGEGGREGRPTSPTVVGAAPAAAPSRRDIRGVTSFLHNSPVRPLLPAREGSGEGRRGNDSPSVIPCGASDSFLTDRAIGKGSLVAGTPLDDKETRSFIAAAPRDDSEPASPLTRDSVSPRGRGRGDANSHLPRNQSPQKSVLPLGDGMAPLHPPSPCIPGEGGIFFGPPPPHPAAPAQLPLLP